MQQYLSHLEKAMKQDNDHIITLTIPNGIYTASNFSDLTIHITFMFGCTMMAEVGIVRPNMHMEVMCIVKSLKFEAVYIPFVYC